MRAGRPLLTFQRIVLLQCCAKPVCQVLSRGADDVGTTDGDFSKKFGSEEAREASRLREAIASEVT